MRAAVVHAFDKPLVVEEVPTPVSGPGEVLVKIETSGLCHTDIHAAHGDWPVKPSLPFVPGHEGVGIVGLPADNEMRLPIFETVINGITVMGSIVGTRVDLAETFELHAQRHTRVVRETRQLEQVNEAFDEVLQSRVPARLVFDLR